MIPNLSTCGIPEVVLSGSQTCPTPRDPRGPVEGALFGRIDLGEVVMPEGN